MHTDAPMHMHTHVSKVACLAALVSLAHAHARASGTAHDITQRRSLMAQSNLPACSSGTTTEYETCGTCVPDCASKETAFRNCTVSYDLGGSLGLWNISAWQAFSFKCDTTYCDTLMKEEITDNPDCCFGGRCTATKYPCPNKACGDYGCGTSGLPNAKSIGTCPAAIVKFWGSCRDKYEVNNTIVEKNMNLLYGTCKSVLVSSVAKNLYKSISEQFDVPLAFWTLIFIPFLFFVLVAFMGRHISAIFRMMTGYMCTTLPLLIPVIAPYMAGCNHNLLDGEANCDKIPEFTTTVATSLFMALYVGCIGAYVSVKHKHYGNAIQGFALSYITVLYTVDYWLHDLRASNPELEGFVDWAVLAITVILGVVLAVLNVKFPTVLNVLCSAFIGTFVAMQIVCIAGLFENWFWTFEVSIAAIAMGVPGCTVGGCWGFLFFWIFVTLMALVSQWKFAKIDHMDELEEATKFEKFLYTITEGFVMLSEVDSSLSEASEYHSPEELAILAERHSRTWVKAATMISDVTCIVFAVALWVGCVELYIRGIFTSSGSSFVLGILIFCASFVTVLLTCYEIRLHSAGIHEDHTVRIKKFNIYIWGLLILMPLAVLVAICTWGLAFAGDPIGLYKKIFGVGLLTAAQDIVLHSHMKVAGVASVLLVLSLAFTAAFVSKNLGGFSYLAMKLSLFVSWLVMVYGAFIFLVGYTMAPENLGEVGSDEVGLYHFFGIVGAFMFLSGWPGVLGSIMIHKCGVGKAKCLLKIFVILLFLLLLLNAGAFGYAGKYISSIDATIDKDWQLINETLSASCNHADCLVTKASFVSQAKAGFRFVLILGVVTTGYLFMGLVSTCYMVTLDDATISQADKLLERHARAYLDADEAEQLRKSAGVKSEVQKYDDIDGVKTKKTKRQTKKAEKAKKKRAATIAVEGESPRTTFDVEDGNSDMVLEQEEGGGWGGGAEDEPVGDDFVNPLASPVVQDDGGGDGGEDDGDEAATPTPRPVTSAGGEDMET